MESTDREVLRAAAGWLRDGHGVTLITIVRTWGSSPRPLGSLAAVRADGRLVGSVSGGCVEEDLIARLRDRAEVLPEVIVYGGSSEEAHRFGLPCGGRLELVVETLRDPGPLQIVLETMDARRLIARQLDIPTGEAVFFTAGRNHEFSYDGRIVTKMFGPAWRLLIIGAGQLSRYLAEMALALDYQVIVCDPREEVAAAWALPGVDLDARMPDDAVAALASDERSAVVALAHDPRIDDMALMTGLDSRAFYVGALGSRANNAKRKKRLALLDVSAAGLARLHGPVGLPIGSRTPPEIAVSILAELTAVRHGVRLEPVATAAPATAGSCT